MSEIHETIEKAHEGALAEGFNKRIALVIAVLALFLSFSETLGKSAQMEAIDANVKSSDTWTFFQAKDIRRTVVRSACGRRSGSTLLGASATDAATKAAIESKSRRGAKPRHATSRTRRLARAAASFAVRAKAEEEERDLAMARYHHHEPASAAFQIGIVSSPQRR